MVKELFYHYKQQWSQSASTYVQSDLGILCSSTYTTVSIDSVSRQRRPRSACANLSGYKSYLELWEHALTMDLLFDITRKAAFYLAWHFILNENILFRLTIYYKKTFVFSVSVLCSQIFTRKLNLTAKKWSNPGNFYCKVILWNFYRRKYFFVFFGDF